MKIRNLLVGFALAMMVLFAGSFTTTAHTDFCNRFCTLNNYNPCMEGCASGDFACYDACQADYDCCYYMCSRGNGEPCPYYP
jgi:hypothetical protein